MTDIIIISAQLMSTIHIFLSESFSQAPAFLLGFKNCIQHSLLIVNSGSHCDNHMFPIYNIGLFL